jgi:hypothetical protein
MNMTNSLAQANYSDLSLIKAAPDYMKRHRRPRGIFMYEFLIWACRKS